MRNDLELYIGGEKVDLGQSTKVLFNYKQKELNNPTIVKNSFSKTVELEKTDTNNKIFGHIWNLNRTQADASFNPSKRVDFVLMLNGELIESGYCKLDKIKDNYSITLYGGLGDFFYNLMYDSATGEKKNLSSLDFGYDLDFTINKDTLRQAWAILLDPVSDIDNKWKVVNFAPCYNGISDQLDADKVLINTSGITAGMRKWEDDRWVDINGFPTTVNNEYNLVNGYGFAELPKAMDEWQIRDIRSYLQRPVIRMKGIIEACCNPVNNGGYEVELDNTFFNSSNPYYRYSWITLPMLNDLGAEVTEEELSLSVGEIKQDPYRLSTVELNGVLPRTDNFQVSLKLRMSTLAMVNPPIIGQYAYTSANVRGTKCYGAYCCYLAGFDGGGALAGVSDAYWLTSYIDNELDYFSAADAQVTVNAANITTKVGVFQRVGDRLYEWPETLSFDLNTNGTKITKLVLFVVPVGTKDYQGCVFPSRSVSATNRYFDVFGVNNPAELTGGYEVSEGTVVNSNTYISKTNLLSTDETPADYLIGFCKLFNLYFEKDTFKKKIYIKTQREYYDGQAIDIDDKIDRSKKPDINPLSFDTKWYELNYKTEDESEVEQNYYDNYGTQFGKQKINTGYDFNGEAKDLLQSPFVNAVQVLESGKYYAVGQTDFWNEIPTFLFNNVTYKLFNSENDSTDILISEPRSLSIGLINKNSDNSLRYDAFPKVQFHNGTDTIDGKNVLLFFNGFQTIRSNQEYQPKYMITDDINEMFLVNDGKPCWLYTKSEFDINGNRIAWEEKSIPQFSRYTTVDKTDDVYYSWDFGRTKQFYVPAYAYTSADSTIYERYWKRYLNDLYDIDTRVVECYVKFDEKVIPNYLKHFYYFDNSYWVISEIIDYNPASYDTVRVKFVKVNDLQAYTDYNPAITPNATILITLDNPNVAATGGTVNGYVYVADGGAWTFSSWDNGLTPSITGGTGSTSFSITVSPNLTDLVKGLHITARRNTYTDTATVMQESGGVGFNVTPSELVWYNTGGTLELTITDPVLHTWRVVGYPDWTSFNTYSGGTSVIISVTARENTTGIDKEGTIVVYDYDDNKTYLINAKQTDNQGDSAHLNVQQFAQYTYTNVPQTGGTCLYTVRSTSPWTVVSDREYCVPLRSGGTGNTLYGETLEVNWPDNTSFASRRASMTFRNTEGYEVIVWKGQDGIYITTMEFDATGETKSITFDADSDVVTKSPWVDVREDSGGTYYIIAEPNDTGAEREGQIILENQDGQQLTINVVQEAEGGCCDLINSFRVVPNELYYEGNGGIQYFFINNPNGDSWTLTGYPWGKPNVTYGSQSAIIAFSVPANSGDTRYEYVTVDNSTNSGDTKLVYIEQGTGITKTLTINPKYINAEASGGTYQVTLNCTNFDPTSDIIIESHSSGLTVGAINFTGDSAVVDITVPVNETDNPKGHMVMFILNGDSSTHVSVYINQKPNQIEYPNEYLTIEATSSGDIIWKANNSGISKTVEYKLNDGEWTTVTSSTEGISISVDTGDIVKWRGNNTSYGNSTSYITFSGTNCEFITYGNIMSLISSTGFSGMTTLTENYTFRQLFLNCTGLTDAGNLILPATALTEFCYASMFQGCTSLVNVPVLPATVLASNCYNQMFLGCHSLVYVPVLPATTLARECYTGMFADCTSLVTAPVLPATNMEIGCYWGMFMYCTSLVNAPVLASTSLDGACYQSMFQGCTSLVNAPALPATTLAGQCYFSMFQGCSSLTTAPVLPATTLEDGCYILMFAACTNLSTIKCLATTNIDTNRTVTQWVDGVASSGRFIKNANAVGWIYGHSGIPNNWTVQDA